MRRVQRGFVVAMRERYRMYFYVRHKFLRSVTHTHSKTSSPLFSMNFRS